MSTNAVLIGNFYCMLNIRIAVIKEIAAIMSTRGDVGKHENHDNYT